MCHRISCSLSSHHSRTVFSRKRGHPIVFAPHPLTILVFVFLGCSLGQYPPLLRHVYVVLPFARPCLRPSRADDLVSLSTSPVRRCSLGLFPAHSFGAQSVAGTRTGERGGGGTKNVSMCDNSNGGRNAFLSIFDPTE